MAIAFWKMHSSGNDFVVIDNREGEVPEDVPAFTRAVCHRRIGIGADGVILIDDANEADFRWTYLNSDGSRAGMCGNGAMCGARFAVEHGIAPAKCRFETDSGVVEARVEGRRVAIRLPEATAFVATRELEPGLDAASVTVGVPHAVVRTDDVEAITDFPAWGAMVRHHPAFGSEGANANLVQVIDRHTVRVRTFERGVEGETLACGTGAAAVAVVGQREGWLEFPATVIPPSGLALEVDERADGLWLRGEAQVVATGEIGPDVDADSRVAGWPG